MFWSPSFGILVISYNPMPCLFLSDHAISFSLFWAFCGRAFWILVNQCINYQSLKGYPFPGPGHAYYKHFEQLLIAHVWCIKILTWLRGVRDNIAKFSRLHSLTVPRRDLSTRNTKPNIEKLLESPGVMLEFSWIERGLLVIELPILHLSPVQTHTTLLGVTCCVRLYTLLHVIAQSLKPWNLSNVYLRANGRNNFEHRWTNNVSCSVRLHVALQVKTRLDLTLFWYNPSCFTM